ncbi:MAG: Glycerol-3-phosphate dehydrogenase [NAD(P)+] [candidate division TM6 bacterium GW2011_GWF2_37_49]|nr:MAG: Glycerol-3-phosphate dehydrogenase [NAD(P)+] [candidate division TM6 bacterium GW2011_GWF2_37_49]
MIKYQEILEGKLFMERRVTILGAGAWGTAIANHLSQNNVETMLWCFEAEVAQEIEIQKTNNRYLPDIKLQHNVKATTDLSAALSFSEFIVEAIPVKHLRNVLTMTKQHIKHEHRWIMTSKGIESDTFMLPSEILRDVLGYQPNVSALSGPNFAKELIQKNVTAAVIASKDDELAKQVSSIFGNDHFKTYISDDLIGVQAGGALKNVYALTLGILRGLEYSENTVAFVFTKSLEEMTQTCAQIGGRKETMYGLAGLGDLFLTGNCALSKNFKCGKLLGQGINLGDISKKYYMLPEGFSTLKSLMTFSKQFGISLPICQATHDFIFEGKSIKNLLYKLLEQK